MIVKAENRYLLNRSPSGEYLANSWQLAHSWQYGERNMARAFIFGARMQAPEGL
jgi:hypothetical protein